MRSRVLPPDLHAFCSVEHVFNSVIWRRKAPFISASASGIAVCASVGFSAAREANRARNSARGDVGLAAPGAAALGAALDSRWLPRDCRKSARH